MELSDLAQRIGRQRWFAAVGRKLTPLDRALRRATRGRLMILGGPGAPPSLLLTVTGRKSGLPRTVPLLYTEHGDRMLVVGSNWGRKQHPLWSENLIANPDASVEIRGQPMRVHAHLADAAEKRELWPTVARAWPVYDTYTARSGRDLRLFVLQPR